MRRIPVETNIAAGEAVWIEVDLEALAHNVRHLRGRLGRGCQLIAVVKANAYGHGAVPVARALRAAGVTRFAVGSVGEGVELRAAGIDGEILVAGPSLPGQADAAVTARLTPTLTTVAQVRAFAAAAGGDGIDCHVEIDSGMYRHGVVAPAFPDFVRALRANARGRLRLAGVFTHFAGLTAADLPAMRAQLEAFLAALARVRDLGSPLLHACNTFALDRLPEGRLDAVRIGGGLYGLGGLPGGRPVLSLRARIVGLRDAARGDRVGYGGDHVCASPTRLALLPLGYADGLVREPWQGAEVLVRGRRAPIVGRISMNQTILDVTGVPGVRLGDTATLLGADGDDSVIAAQRAAAGHSIYEVSASLRADLPRRYPGFRVSTEPGPETTH